MSVLGYMYVLRPAMSSPGMLSPRGRVGSRPRGLEAKFYGLDLVLGLVKLWPRSRASWSRDVYNSKVDGNELSILFLVLSLSS